MTPAIFGLSGLALTADERAFFRDADPAGYIVFARNVATRAQLRALTDDLRGIHGRERLFVCVDQEGGRVARLRPPEWPAYPPGAVFDPLYDLAPMSAIAAARANAEALALDLAEVGISVDCLPLLDVRQPGAHDVIGDRALGAEPLRVAALGRAMLDGLASGGVCGVIKHIPGHGRALADSHKQLPRVEADEAELAIDLAPFRALAEAPVAMTAHVLYPAWDANNPATLSPFVIGEVIRARVGFAGLLLTDDIDMEALPGSIPERGERAIAAGCDVVLNCWARMDDMVALAARLPAMGEVTARRLEAALAYPAASAALSLKQAQGDRPSRSRRPIETDPAARLAALIATRDTLLALVPAPA